jgi:hypothetical protein
VTYRTEIDDTMDVNGNQSDVTGSLRGGGTVSGSVVNPLAMATSMTQEMDMEVDSGGERLEMRLDIGIEVAPVG